MPRRDVPDPLAAAIGARIRAIRQERGLTLEALAYESELGSKGHLSDLEAGKAVPNVSTLKKLADHLQVRLLDLVTFPDEDAAQQLVDRVRSLPPGTIRRLLRDLGNKD